MIVSYRGDHKTL